LEAGTNTSTVTLRVVRGDEKRSLKTETVLARSGSITKDRPFLSLERAPPKKKTVTLKQ
jgi:hypothetical protein